MGSPDTPKPKLVLVSVLTLLTSLLLAGCPPKAPCDEKIPDPKVYEQTIQADPVIQALNAQLTQRKIDIGQCFVRNQVSAVIQYELPSSFSTFRIIYRDLLSIAYQKDGTIEVAGGINQPSAYTETAILDYFQGRIQELEANPRVQEVVSKTGPDPSNPSTPLFGDDNVLRSGYNRLQYNFYSGLVREYNLSNDIAWEEFPEIQQAHTIMQEHLLVGDLANCSIGYGDLHAYTTVNFHDSSTGPWYITVALQCTDGWKDAYVQINNDGSYEKLRIEREYNQSTVTSK